jgi:acetyl-CoA/propionyl-CoA carboxylase carboxyl transferase subunit
MGSIAAVRILHRRRLSDLPDDVRAQMEQELADEHELIAGGLDKAMALGVVDEVVDPAETRSAVAAAVLAAAPLRGRHGNIPL